MYTTSSVLIYALAAATAVLGSPAPVVKRAPEPRLFYAADFAHPTSSPSMGKRFVSECQAVNAVVKALNAISGVAYPFCSSYIHVPVVTSTISSVFTVTPSPVTVTSILTPAAVSVTSTVTSTSTVSSSTSTIYSHYTPSAAKQKRATPTLPAWALAFGESQISKACSCLSIPTSTTTVTTTVATTLPASTLTATAIAATSTVTVTVTSVATIPGSTTTIPALCGPSALSVTSGVLYLVGNDLPKVVSLGSVTDITSCCVACLGTQNCASYYLNSGACDLIVAVDASSPSTGNAAQAAICPLGVSAQDTIFPPGVVGPESGNGAFHVGPCLADATSLI